MKKKIIKINNLSKQNGKRQDRQTEPNPFESKLTSEVTNVPTFITSLSSNGSHCEIVRRQREIGGGEKSRMTR